MAGPWIKIEHSLPEKPEVMRLSELLKIREEQAVGRNHCKGQTPARMHAQAKRIAFEVAVEPQG